MTYYCTTFVNFLWRQHDASPPKVPLSFFEWILHNCLDWWHRVVYFVTYCEDDILHFLLWPPNSLHAVLHMGTKGMIPVAALCSCAKTFFLFVLIASLKTEEQGISCMKLFFFRSLLLLIYSPWKNTMVSSCCAHNTYTGECFVKKDLSLQDYNQNIRTVPCPLFQKLRLWLWRK